MARGDFKANPHFLITAQRATYVDVRTGVRRKRDVAVFEGLPSVIGVALIAIGVHLPTAASVGLLTVCGLFSALLFGVLLQVAQRAMDLADSAPAPSAATTRHTAFLGELSANAGYASLVCILASIAFVVSSTTGGWPLRISSGIGLALGAHLVLTLLMTMKRVHALTVERLTRARTGADRARAGRAA